VSPVALAPNATGVSRVIFGRNDRADTISGADTRIGSTAAADQMY